MGNAFRRWRRPGQRRDEGAAVSRPASPPATKLDPNDFMVMRTSDATVVRGPGSISGQQFIIDSVNNCNIFLFDHSAQVTIDFATNCRIFIGPCESSVFFRDCRSCRAVVACQQLRTRDCSGLDLRLFCSTQPSIETTSDLTLACFQASYFSLAAQFQAAGLCVWNNSWWRVHDFSAGDDDQQQHYSIVVDDDDSMTRSAALDAFLGRNPSEVCSDIGREETLLASPVPLVMGSERDGGSIWFVLVIDDVDKNAYAMIDNARLTLKLLETRRATLSRVQVEQLFMDVDVDRRPPSSGTTTTTIGLSFVGASRPTAPSGDGAIVAGDQASSRRMADLFFRQFRPIV